MLKKTAILASNVVEGVNESKHYAGNLGRNIRNTEYVLGTGELRHSINYCNCVVLFTVFSTLKCNLLQSILNWEKCN